MHEPDRPQPVPPPAPAPQPPRYDERQAAEHPVVAEPPTVPGPTTVAEPPTVPGPPTVAEPPNVLEPPKGGQPTVPVLPIGDSAQPGPDRADEIAAAQVAAPSAADTSIVEYPPVGAYPGEPGHPEQPGPDWQPPAPAVQWQPDQSGPTGQWQPDQPWPASGPEQQPWQVAPAAPRGRRTVLWVSLILGMTLLLCGGGGVSAFLLLRNTENGDGAPDPATAVTRFLTAVYTDKDATAATNLVCSEARDRKKISAKVDEVKEYARQYAGPRFRWDDPSVASETDERALVTVALTMTTDDEKTAEQQLTFTAVKKTGWWVCEVAG